MIKSSIPPVIKRMRKMKKIRIATRNSPLALWQANYVKERLEQVHEGLSVDIVGMTTKGDQLLDRSLVAVGGKGLFLKELEVSLLDGETDIAVHSMKDVPVDLPKGLEISVVCEREDPRDAFVSNTYQNLYALPKGARVGTSSLRRVAQLKHAFKDLEFLELRGNVNTRLRKLDDGDYDAIILATAGLKRLGLEDRIKQYIAPDVCLPAVGQGIVGIECRSDDEATKELLKPLHSVESELMLAAERSMNASLEGGCQVPVAGYAEIKSGKLELRGMVGKVDGSTVLADREISTRITVESAEILGQTLAEELQRRGASEILREVYREPPQLKKVEKPVVILTRQNRYLGNTAAILQRLDFQPAHIPTLDIEPNFDTDLIGLFTDMESYTDLVFVSRNAVEVGMKMIGQHGGVPKSVRVMAVGAETAKQLYGYKIDALFPEVGSGAEALLKVGPLKDLNNRKIMIIRGTTGLDWPAEKMRERGAEVVEAKVYTQTTPKDCQDRLREVFDQNARIVGLFAHSSQSLENLVAAAGEFKDRLLDVNLVVGSENIKNTAIDLGWTGDLHIANSPSNKHMMIAFSGIK